MRFGQGRRHAHIHEHAGQSGIVGGLLVVLLLIRRRSVQSGDVLVDDRHQLSSLVHQLLDIAPLGEHVVGQPLGLLVLELVARQDGVHPHLPTGQHLHGAVLLLLGRAGALLPGPPLQGSVQRLGKVIPIGTGVGRAKYQVQLAVGVRVQTNFVRCHGRREGWPSRRLGVGNHAQMDEPTPQRGEGHHVIAIVVIVV